MKFGRYFKDTAIFEQFSSVIDQVHFTYNQQNEICADQEKSV